MPNTLTTINDVEVFLCGTDVQLATERDALDLIGESIQCSSNVVVVPVESIDEEFFHLKTGLAGNIMQKFVTYRRHLVIVGEITQYVETSRALCDFVYETNKGTQVWFLADMSELSDRLGRLKAS